MLDTCLVGLPGGAVGLTEVVEDLGFDGPVADLATQCQRLLVVLGGLLMATLL